MKTVPRLLGTIFLGLLASTSVFGRIGESPEEIEKRYGPGQRENPRFPDSVEMKYSKDGFVIFVHFMEGKSVMEQFKRVTNAKWANREIATFLKTFTDGTPRSGRVRDCDDTGGNVKEICAINLLIIAHK